jgi:4-carboxymuconolactone decarboxylase
MNGASDPKDEDRAPPLPDAKLDADQRAAVAEFRAVRGTGPEGPWHPLLRSPELMSRARAMGDYVRYRTSLPPRLTELLILLTAREWGQAFEWSVHCPIALESGLAAETVAAIAEGRRPPAVAADETLLQDFFHELTHNRRISDATYAAMRASFGDRGIYDAVGIVGYYTLLAMTLNTAQTPARSAPYPLRPLP